MYYKVYMQNRGGSRQVIYNSTAADRRIVKPAFSMDWNQPGSFDFTVLPGHPNYADFQVISSYISIELVHDNNQTQEIFYGRILTIDTDMFGQKQVSCEGALNFLKDGEFAPLQNEDGETMTVSAFFASCVSQYNSTAAQNDSLKNLQNGGVTLDDNVGSSSELFQVKDYTDVKSIVDGNLVNRFGGCVVVEKTNSGHSISYKSVVGRQCNQQISLGQNIIDKTDHASGEDVFSVLRPIGASVSSYDGNGTTETHDVKLSGSGVIEIPSMISRYGRIYKTQRFSDQETEASLRAEANKFIARKGMSTGLLPATCDISFVDFHLMNPSIDYVGFGDVFTNIEGFAGQTLVVGMIERDLEDPGNDKLTFYNKTYLESRDYTSILASKTGTGNNYGSGSGGSRTAKALAAADKELQDQLIIGGQNIKDLKVIANSQEGQITLAGHQINLASDILFGRTREMHFILGDDSENPDDGTLYLDGMQVHANQNGLWAVHGKVRYDENGDLVIKEGVGLAVERRVNNQLTTFGVYDDYNLTAGTLVNKITNDNTSSVQTAFGTYINGKLDAGVIVNKISTDTAAATQTMFGTYVNGLIDAGVVVEKLNNDNTTYILGDKVVFGTPTYTYTSVSVSANQNPYALGYYERVGSSYVRTSDANPEPGKIYFQKVPNTAKTVNGKLTDVDVVINGRLSATSLDAKYAQITDLFVQNGTKTGYLQANTGIWSKGDLDVDGSSYLGGAHGIAVEEAGSSTKIYSYGPLYIEGGLRVYKTDGESMSLYTQGDDLSGFFSTLKVGGANVANAVASFGTPTSSNGQISIPWTKLDGTSGTPINFNIADTQYYKDGVSAALAQGKSDHTATAISKITLTSSNTGSDVTKYPYVTYSNGDVSSSIATTIDASAVYAKGLTDVGVYMVVGSNSSYSTSLTIPAGESRTLYPKKYIDGSWNSSNCNSITVTAGSSSDRYEEGWNDCANTLDLKWYDSSTGSYHSLAGQSYGFPVGTNGRYIYATCTTSSGSTKYIGRLVIP